MPKTDSGFHKTVNLTYEQTIVKVTEELKKEGFGILTEIDVKETLKKKLNIDFKRYHILGACNPHLAHRALETENDVGLFMPCNVIVYEDGNHVTVSIANPMVVLAGLKNHHVDAIAGEASDKLKKALLAV